MDIRLAGLHDLDLLCRMRIDFLAEHRSVLPTSFTKSFIEETRSFLDRTHRADVVRSWLAEEEGEPVGLASVFLHDVPPLPEDGRTREGLIINMYVTPVARRRGVGQSLLQACLSSSSELGIRRFYLRSTDAGRSMYLRAGFRNHDDLLELGRPQ